MNKVSVLIVLMMGAFLVSAAPTFPQVTPEEASSLGLKLIYSGGGSTTDGGTNSYEEFSCPTSNKDVVFVVTLMATYYPDGSAGDKFTAYHRDWMNKTDSSWSSNGETYRVHYEVSGGDGYFIGLHVEEDTYTDHSDDSASYEYSYMALVGDYLVTLNARYSTRYPPTCNVNSVLPRLFNLYLSKFEGNTVRVPENVSTATQGNVSGGSGHSVGSPVGGLSPEARERMSKTTARIASLGDSIEVQTPNGKLVKLSSGKASTALGWKAKYYGNKALDSLIDGASSLLPSPLGLFKDYVKGYKDSLVFNESESVRKTAKDLHVSGKSASLYNKMNSIEAREKALSPYKNAVPTSIATKPIETVLSSMGLAIKKTLAQDYEWEFRKTAETAVRYRKMGLKYNEVIRNTVDEVMETTQGMNRVHMLNRNSGGEYSDQEARIRFYINQLFEEGKI